MQPPFQMKWLSDFQWGVASEPLINSNTLTLQVLLGLLMH